MTSARTEKAVEILDVMTVEPITVFVIPDGPMMTVRFATGRAIRLSRNQVNALIRRCKAWKARQESHVRSAT